MSPRRLDQAHPFLTLGLLVGMWLVIPTLIKSFTRAPFYELTAPVSVAASHARDLREYWSLRLHSNNELIAAGRDLARLNASYDIASQENAEMRAQLARLENILRIPAQPEFRSEHARVARRESSGWWQQLIIRKGRNFGLTLNAPVIFSGGLVGRIAEVRAYTSVVELISSPGFRITASVEGDTRAIIFQGGINASFSAPIGVIENAPLDLEASPTRLQRLVTSSLGGIYPPGLTIGQVFKVETSTEGLFKTGEVQLDERLSALTEVTVLVPLNPE